MFFAMSLSFREHVVHNLTVDTIVGEKLIARLATVRSYDSLALTGATVTLRACDRLSVLTHRIPQASDERTQRTHRSER
jgi:hypothetical protein